MSALPETPELFPKPVAPQAFVGLASPLWGLFAGAAMSGVAFWWMTRWTRPQNLEAMFGAVGAELDALPEQIAELVAEPPLKAVGGEAAPVSPLEEALVEAEAAAPVETVVEAVEAAAPAAEAAVETVAEAQVEVAEAVVEAAPEPVVPEVVKAAPTPKPKPKAPAEPRSVAPRSQPAAQPK